MGMRDLRPVYHPPRPYNVDAIFAFNVIVFGVAVGTIILLMIP